MVRKISKTAEDRINSGQSLSQLCKGRLGALSVRQPVLKPNLWEPITDKTESSVLNFGLTLVDRGYTADQAAKRLAAETPRSSCNDMNRWREVLEIYKRSKSKQPRHM